MALYEPLVPARYTAALLALVARRDPALVPAALARAGLGSDWPAQPDPALGVAQFDALFEALCALSGRDDLGFDLGLALDRRSHGALGLALSRCATVGDMLLLVARHARLLTPAFALEFRRHADGADLLWRPAAGMSPTLLHAFYDIHVVSLYRLLDELLGPALRPYEAIVPMQRPPHAGRYASLPKLAVRYQLQPLPAVRTRLSVALLDQPLPATAGAGEAAPDAASLRAASLRHAPSDGWSDWLRLMLREAEGVQPTQAALAGLLNVSAHTLARQLAREGQAFRQIAVEVRHRRACSLLGDPALGLAQIAQRLGYADTTNFIHAFRRVEGCTPAVWRSRRAAPTPAR